MTDAWSRSGRYRAGQPVLKVRGDDRYGFPHYDFTHEDLRWALYIARVCGFCHLPGFAKDIRSHVPAMPFLSLPNELILLVGECLDRPHDINHLLLANRRLASVLMALLHKSAVRLEDTQDGRTPLQWAVRRNYEPLVRILLAHNVDVNAIYRYRNRVGAHWSVLYEAVHFSRKTAMVKLLLEAGASVDLRIFSGHTALHAAAQIGSAEIVNLLIRHGAGVSIRGLYGQTPLHLAAMYGHEAIIRLLVDAGADAAAEEDYGHTAIEQAGTRVELDRHGNPPPGYDHVRIIRPMLKGVVFGRDPTFTPAEVATPALHDAVARRSAVKIAHLFDLDVCLDATDREGRTALHVAVQNQDERFVLQLLLGGADPGIRNLRQMTALHEAVRLRNVKIVQTLLRWGANIEAPGFHGKTPLFYAVEHNNVSMVTLLLRKSAAVTALLQDQATALHAAAFLGFVEVAALLLENGADVLARDRHHFTPQTWFREFSHLREDRAGEMYRAMERLLETHILRRMKKRGRVQRRERWSKSLAVSFPSRLRLSGQYRARRPR